MNLSFACIATNQKAVAEQGWGPLNYNLLLQPEIQLTSTWNLQTEANNNQTVSFIPKASLKTLLIRLYSIAIMRMITAME